MSPALVLPTLAPPGSVAQGLLSRGWVCLAVALLVGVAGCLLLPSVPLSARLPRSRERGVAEDQGGVSGLVLTATVLLVSVSLLWVIGPAALALGIALLGGGRLAQAGRRRAIASHTAGAIAEVCHVLASELRSGRPAAAALSEAVAAWPPLAAVVRADAVGLSVPASLRHLADRPGASDLRVVASAWQLASESGHGLGLALDRVSHGLREASRTRRVVAAELASARSTSRLLALLPVPALLLGSGAGGDPWAFLLHTPVGAGCLVVGVALQLSGLLAIESIAESVERSC